MVKRTKRSGAKEQVNEAQMQIAEGSAKITLNDVYAMFYVLVRQNEQMADGNVMSFPLEVFKTLPKKPRLQFINQDGFLTVTIPDDNEFKAGKTDLYLPEKSLILRKG